jgi:putative NADH-flavin reductase
MSSEPATPVLVTGGSGYLGRWCIRQLLEAGYSARTTVRNVSKIPEVCSAFGRPDQLSIVTADLRADDSWKQAVTGCDYVLHVASPFPPAQPKDPDELSAIIGPLLGDHRSYSIQTVERLLLGSAPAIPRLGYAFVDVRDVADPVS